MFRPIARHWALQAGNPFPHTGRTQTVVATPWKRRWHRVSERTLAGRGILRQLLPQPCHRSIEMMQIEPRDPGDGVISRQRSAARSEPLMNNRCSTVRNMARSSAKPCLRLPASSVITARHRDDEDRLRPSVR
jgi:hypothetical protein